MNTAFTSSEDDIVALVMAAGNSRRFGPTDKRRVALTNGRTLLATSVARAIQTLPFCRVVIREDDDPSLLGLEENTSLIRVHRAHLGLGASLAEAMSVISQDPELRHAIAVAILLGDMPNLQQTTLKTLQRLATHDTILRPCYAGTPGHPVIFGRIFWPELVTLRGESGAKSLIQRYSSHYREHEVQDAGILIDIDTPADIAHSIHSVPLAPK